MIDDQAIGRSMETSSTLEPGKREQEILIRPSRGWVSLNLAEIWEYRELVYFLAWRDVVVRYKQTVLGVTWAIIQPFFTMIIFSLFFGALARIPSEGVPYPVFTFTALVPWTFFANGLTQASNSLVGSANLIKKVYFPRLSIPISVVLAGLPDLALSFVVLIGMIFYYGVTPPWAKTLWIPVFVLLAIVSSLGVGLWLAALNVQYRDVRYVVGFVTQLWLFVTPVAYPARLVPDKWKLLYGVNPMVAVVEGFRWTLLGIDSLEAAPLAVSTVTALLILVTGMYYFRRMEKTFADLA